MKLRVVVRWRSLVTVSALLLIGLAVIWSTPPVRWRLELVGLQVAGAIPDIALGELLTYIAPGSDQSMRRLIETRNPYAVIKNFHVSPTDIIAGGELYRAKCASCHAPDGSGGPAPALIAREYKHGASDWAIYRAIRLGISNTAMQPHPLRPTQLWQLVAFVRTLDSSRQDPKLNTATPL